MLEKEPIDYRELPMLPLRGLLVFPYTVIHLDVGRKRSINAIEEAMLATKEIFLATQKEPQNDDPSEDDIYAVGTVAEIKQILKMPGGTMRVLVEGICRARVVSYRNDDDFIKVTIEEFRNEAIDKNAELEALTRTLIYQFEQYVRMSKKIPPETVASVVTIEEPARLADVIASHLSLRINEKQSILEALDISERLNKLCEILAKE
ncbi:MAG TPA: LON peptidase substrate-binding domain-containing protein, partial [Syntrophomonas sp.]|nr:LON peptidase substrate-binding domain-containing protein [Syntrophomonas sp.]